MKNKIILCLAFFAGAALYAVSVVTEADQKAEYGDEIFYFYVKNNTGEDISFCKKNSNPIKYKSDTVLKITEHDFEVEDLGSKHISEALIETIDHIKIQMYQEHGDFFMKLEHQEPLELHIHHVYEIVFENEEYKIKDISA